MAGKKRKAPSPPPPRADTLAITPLSKLSGLRPGDVLQTENGQRYVYTADLRGSRWGRAMDGYAVGELVQLPDAPMRVVFSPNAERQEQKEAVVDPMTETRK